MSTDRKRPLECSTNDKCNDHQNDNNNIHNEIPTPIHTPTPTPTSTPTPQQQRGRPNKSLTKQEKDEKKRLKKKLKMQQKIQKLETRIRHAISRKDPIIEQKTRLELKVLLGESNSDAGTTDETDINTDRDNNVSNYNDNDNDNHDLRGQKQEEQQHQYHLAKNIILDISNKLFKSFSDENISINTKNVNDGNGKVNNRFKKDHETECAVKLLRNMTKGTVSQSMFDNRAALLGYTRQKFFERAMLLYTSMDKLRRRGQPTIHANGTSDQTHNKNNCNNNDIQLVMKQMKIREKIWNKVQTGQVRTFCAIGCGPGNDAVGLLTFLHCANHHNVKLSSSSSKSSSFSTIMALDEIILMDWSIEQWDNAVLKSLYSVLQESNLLVGLQRGKMDQMFKTCFCDVMKPFNDGDNNDARNTIQTSSCDVYLISYLLSETNGRWESFFAGLVHSAKSESLFYFAEPTPWQLHRFIELFSKYLDFVWLDSSMDCPSMQSLDGRLGPAVLAAIKR